MAQRILFIDVAKGCAIIGVILVHALIHGVWYFPENALKVLPLWVLALLSPLVILATWAGFFELMSGLSNGYNIYDRIYSRNQTFKRAAQGPLVNSTGLLIMHFIYVIFFSHRRNSPYPTVSDGQINTMISGSMELGKFHMTSFQFFFFADVLGSIALAGYFSILLLWILYKFDVLENVEKSSIILLLTTIGFFLISYIVYPFGYNLIVVLLKNGSPGALLLALPLSMLTGAFQPFFPIAGFGLIGAILGMYLSIEQDSNTISAYGQSIPHAGTKAFIDRYAPISLVLFVILLGDFIFIQGNRALDILVYFQLPPALLALNLGLMLYTIKMGIILFEDPDDETRRRRARKTTIIRRFGMATLSVYTFESVINGLFSYQFHRIFDNPSTPVDESFTAMGGIFLYLTVIFTFWFTFIYLWEKIDFKFGIEYWIIKLGTRFRSSKSNKLNIGQNLYDPLNRKETIKVKSRQTN